MPDDDTTKSLAAVLGYLVGRPLKLREILEALQMSKSRYYLQVSEGRLITADNLLRAAHNLGINEVDLLARYGMITDESAIAYVDGLVPAHPSRPGGMTTQTTAAAPTTTSRRRRVRADADLL
ncbi:immunity repressor [Mycobacterium phage BoostSeason]|uniref:Immunity repressor n=1 Tax=Mycobacterium phage Mufasa TaxID=1718600 RepID=A0A0M4QU88_9CAUD|nr:transcriptional repressor [Mycobacterium phage Mufasa]ALF00480.1 immunity repressor [Mycobacterium phage Mufasa]AYN57219.1 immunity repressor [Mycobacterium phage BoostSeason]